MEESEESAGSLSSASTDELKVSVNCQNQESRQSPNIHPRHRTESSTGPSDLAGKQKFSCSYLCENTSPRMTSVFNRQINFSALAQFSDLSKSTQDHLFNVYSTLGATVASAAVGAYLHLLYNFGGLLTAITGIALIFAIYATKSGDTRKSQTDRVALLTAFGFVQGASIGPLIAYVAGLEGGEGIIATAFVGTCLIFASFTLAALTSPRRSYLYLAGFLSSALSTLVLLGFVNALFLHSSLVDSIRLYLGLIVFTAFVLFDTQLIVEKAELGDRDYVQHALELFMDFINLFVKLLRLLSKKEKKEKSSNR